MIRTKMAMWWTWARVAIRCTGAAGLARKNGAPAWKYEAAEAAALSAEFEWSISAIAACAFAIEALSKELDEGGRQVDKSNLKPGRKVSAGYYKGHHIVQVFGVPDPPASNLIDRLEELFRLRNDAVHFESTWHDGLHRHPSGTDTGYELTVYTFEQAQAAVGLVQDVFETIRDSVGKSSHHAAADFVGSQILGVLRMMAEVRKAEGV